MKKRLVQRLRAAGVSSPAAERQLSRVLPRSGKATHTRYHYIGHSHYDYDKGDTIASWGGGDRRKGVPPQYGEQGIKKGRNGTWTRAFTTNYGVGEGGVLTASISPRGRVAHLRNVQNVYSYGDTDLSYTHGMSFDKPVKVVEQVTVRELRKGLLGGGLYRSNGTEYQIHYRGRATHYKDGTRLDKPFVFDRTYKVQISGITSLTKLWRQPSASFTDGNALFAAFIDAPRAWNANRSAPMNLEIGKDVQQVWLDGMKDNLAR
jgi:hypothetical protein